MDDLDRALVRALTVDGRRSNVDLARELQVTEKTVRNRIARLVDQGLRITARLGPGSSGVQMIYLLHAAPGRRLALHTTLSVHPDVTSVELATGAADLVVTAHFQTPDEALNFHLAVLEDNPMIAGSSACHLVRGADGPMADHAVPAIDQQQLTEFVLHRPRLTDRAALAQRLVDLLPRIFSADHALVAVRDDTLPMPDDLAELADLPLTTATYGFDADYPRRVLERFRSADQLSVTQRVLTTKQHVFIDDVATSPLLAPSGDLVRSAGYRSLLAFPLVFGRDAIGFMAAYYDRQVSVDTGYLTAMQGFLDHAAILLARAGDRP